MVSLYRSRSGYTAKRREFWVELRKLELALYPHLPALDHYHNLAWTFDSPLVRLEERFLAKVRVNLVTDCHIWAAGLDRNGYGQYSTGGHTKLAHRYAYEQMVGPIPDLTLDHRPKYCHRYCVFWEHLEPASVPENTVRAFERQVDTGFRPAFQQRFWRPGHLPPRSQSND